MKVAMIVHNDVLRDARVLKEASSLAAAGHVVEVHGLSREGTMERTVPGTAIPVFLVPKAPLPPRSPVGWIRSAMIAAAAVGAMLVLGLLVLVTALLISLFGLGPLATVAAVAVAATGVFACARRDLTLSFLARIGHGARARLFRGRSLARKASNWLGEVGPLHAALCAGAAALALAAVFALLALAAGPSPATALAAAVAAAILVLLAPARAARAAAGKHLGRAERWLRARVGRQSDLLDTLILQNFMRISDAVAASVESRPRPDVVHIHDHVCLTAAGRLREALSCRIVWDAHEIYEDLATHDPARGRVNAAVIAGNQRHVDAFITINDSIADFYRARYPALGAPIILKNATVAAPVPEDDGRLHRAASLPPDRRILLFQGGFAPNRGLEELVEAAGAFDEGWSLVLMGWGTLEPELREAAARHDGDTSRIVFLPGVPHGELQTWTAGATLGAIPYRNTSLNHLYCTPNKLWEYPHAGVPILATDLVEMRRVVGAHGTGFLLPRDFTAMDIAKAVNGLTDGQLAEARARCRDFAMTDHWGRYETRLQELYDRLEEDRQAHSE